MAVQGLGRHEYDQNATGLVMNGSTVPTDHDRELLRSIAGGDQASLGELYELYGQRMFAYARRLVDDSALAEDILQDVLVVVWRTAGNFRGEGRMLAWLLGIVHHTSMKALRGRTNPLSDSLAENIRTPEPSPEEWLQRDQQAQWVQRGLQDLSPEHRAVLELVFYQGLDLKEIAQVCDCPVGTVKSRLSYARQHLRGILTRNPDVEDWR
jgi:RNA polymerase sigma-70 factor (ECF subfamily)